MKYWLGIVSHEHVIRGQTDQIAQVCHGKKGPLTQMKAGDWLIYYSPSTRMRQPDGLKMFTALGQIADDHIYAFDMGGGFVPYRRKVNYRQTRSVRLTEVKEKLELTQNPYWGYQLRRGLIAISKHDFSLIAECMLSE